MSSVRELPRRLEPVSVTVSRPVPVPEDRATSGEGPLSFSQEHLWFLHQLHPDSPAYNIAVALRVSGRLDPEVLQRVLTEIVRRHSALRTRFVNREERPVAVVDSPGPIPLPVVAPVGLPGEDVLDSALREARDHGRRPFDLARGPLFSAELIRLSPEDHVFAISLHHIVSDAWSVSILQREIAALYDAFARGEASPLPEPPLQYDDYARRQREAVDAAHFDRQLAYWKSQLSELATGLELPADRPRPAVPSFRGAVEQRALGAGLTRAIAAFSRREGITPFTTLLAAFWALLSRYTGQEDIAIGSGVTNRDREELEDLIGFFVDTLVLRPDLSGDPTFRELIRRARDVFLEANAHHDVPLTRLVRELHPERDLAHNPFFQVAFVQSLPGAAFEASGVRFEPVSIDYGTAKFDLVLSVDRDGDRFRMAVEYSTDLFEAWRMSRLLEHFENLLEGAMADPAARLSELPLASEEEKRLLLAWSGAESAYPRDRSIPDLFEALVERDPTSIAVSLAEKRWTYGELNDRANRLARFLLERGVGPEEPVGVALERGLDSIVAILAILKSGAAYVPVDPGCPEARLALQLREAGVRLLLTQERLAGKFLSGSAEILCLDRERRRIRRQSATNPARSTGSESLAYLMSTSGSTGTPKIVEVPHRGVVRLLFGVDYVALDRSRRVLHLAPLSFDASTFEIWGALLHGARCVLFPGLPPTPGNIARVLARERIDTLWLTSSLFNVVLEEAPGAFAGVRQLFVGGEPLSVTHVTRALALLPRTGIVNGYGPTESTTFACVYRIPPDLPADAPTVPIGRPIANTKAYVLDARRRLVPIGVAGELYLGGDGLARGYRGSPERTAEKFLPDFVTGEPGRRLYRTGDRVRFRPDGTIEFLGRLDRQVKIRGFRVEPGEIEHAITGHRGVREAAVLAQDFGPSDRRLVAYYVPDSAGVSPDELRACLKKSLPDYMVPSSLIPVGSLPRHRSGKLDAAGLARQGPRERPHFVAARDPLELQLTKIWEKLLQSGPVGVTDNFFELGGHSLLAARLFAQIERIFGKNLPLATLFDAPTIEHLAAILRSEGWAPSWSSLVAIQPGGSRPPLFCVHSAGGNVLTYRDLARRLGPDQPVYGLQAQGLDGKMPPHRRVEEMAAHYVGEIRSLQPEGPYHLGGSSFGGMIAFEMSQQLRALGQEVDVLALFDTWGPGYGRLLPETTLFGLMFSRLAQRVDLHVGNFLIGGPREKAAYVREKVLRVLRNVRKIARRYAKRFHQYGSFRDKTPPALRQVERASFEAIYGYTPKPYAGKITLFRAHKQPSGIHPDPLMGWGSVAAGGLDVHEVPGYHGAIVYEPRVKILAEKLAACLDQAQGIRRSP